MPESDSSQDVLLEQLAEEFVERYRRGERPTLGEYVERYPSLADDIRDLFPALVKVEELKPGSEDVTGPFALLSELPQERLGDYVLLREIGRGGMGVVYEAEQTSLGRRVALKVLPPQAIRQGNFLERFQREARAAAKLHHTNIVPVFGVGECGGVYYYAMQFIQGESLDKVLRDLRRLRQQDGLAAGPAESSVAQSLARGRFSAPPVEGQQPPTASEGASGGLASGTSMTSSQPDYYRAVARVALQVAEALEYAHKQGVLHRDVKPSNLLLDLRGTAWVTDFGLAKAEGSDDLTQTGDFVGTLRYVGPERFEGQSLPQSDVYGLGVTLYELLTLRPAFDEPNKARLVEKVQHEAPLPPRRIDSSIPRDLETIVLKCVAKNPRDRYATAGALAEDLERFLADRTIKARRASKAEQLWRWCHRNPLVASLLGAIAAILVAATVSSIILAANANHQRRQAEEARERAIEAERKGRLREAEALIGKAHGIRYSRRPGQRFEALAALKQATAIGRELEQPSEWFDRLRNEAIAALALPDVHITETWEGFPPGTKDADVSADFTLYVRTSQTGVVSVRRVKDDVEVARLSGLGEKVSAAFDQRGMLSLGFDTGEYQLWDVSGTQPVLWLKGRKRYFLRHMRLDGKLLSVVDADGAISIYDVPTGRELHRLVPSRLAKGVCPCLHPTAPLIALRSYVHPTVEIRNFATGELVVELDPPWPAGMGDVEWSPDGRMLAVACGDGPQIELYTFDLDAPSLRKLRTLNGPHTGGTRLTFNQTGDRLAARGWDGIVYTYDVHTGRRLFATPSMPTLGGRTFIFDPTGTRLAAARVGERNDRIGLWSVADAREYRAFASREILDVSEKYVAVHPSGSLIAFSFKDGVSLYCANSGREVGFLPLPRRLNEWNAAICFDGDGALLTNTFSGFLRWPVRPDSSKPGHWILGQPDRLPFFPGNSFISASGDGRVVVQCMWKGYGMHQYAGAWVLHPNSPRPRWVHQRLSVHKPCVSKDGRWAVFEADGGGDVWKARVYETATGRCVLEVEQGDKCRFSPDGRWLVSSGDGGRVYSVGTWRPGLRLGAGQALDVSPDNSLVVMGLTDGIYRLVELATGRELARLEDPEQVTGPAEFTPDGTRLVVAAKDGLRVWDLRLIRQRLKEMGLDWDAPPYPPEEEKKADPVELRILGAELTDPKKMAEYQGQKAVADLYFNPFDPDAHYRLGTHLLAAGNAERAYAHLSTALAFRPGLHEAVVAQRARAAYQLGRWEEAITDASASLKHDPEDNSTLSLRAHANRLAKRYPDAIRDYTALIGKYPADPRLYEFRATCHQALGDQDKARADRATAFGIDPTDPAARNNLAWQLLTGPAAERDPARALRLIQQAVQQQPQNSIFLNTLGIAQYRNKRYKEAVATLQKSLASGKGRYDAFDLFFLAMSHARLGDRDKAQECFEQAVRWVESQKSLSGKHVAELKQFRDEAEEVLGGR